MEAKRSAASEAKKIVVRYNANHENANHTTMQLEDIDGKSCTDVLYYDKKITINAIMCGKPKQSTEHSEASTSTDEKKYVSTDHINSKLVTDYNAKSTSIDKYQEKNVELCCTGNKKNEEKASTSTKDYTEKKKHVSIPNNNNIKHVTVCKDKSSINKYQEVNNELTSCNEHKKKEEKDLFPGLVKFKECNPNVKVILTVGSPESGTSFKNVITDKFKVEYFVNELHQLVVDSGFDGIDISIWNENNGSLSIDPTFFTEFMKILHKKFKDDSKKSEELLIFLTVDKKEYLTTYFYEVEKLMEYIDYITIMVFNYHQIKDGRTGFNAPLYHSSTDEDYTKNVNSTIKHWTEQKLDKSKLLLALPFFGKCLTLKNCREHSLFSPIDITKTKHDKNSSPGSITYIEFYERRKEGGWNYVWDDEVKSSYVYKKNQWMTIDCAPTVYAKIDYVKNEGLAGVAIFWINIDDYQNILSFGKYPLLRHIKHQLDKDVDKNVDKDKSPTPVSCNLRNLFLQCYNNQKKDNKELTEVATSCK